MITGPLHNSAGKAIVYGGQKATTVVGHKLDIDVEEDGCIAKLDFEVALNAGGCTLRVTFGAIPGQSSGGLTSVQLVADSACPGFLDADEDTYTLVDSIPNGFGPFWYGKLGRVPERMADGACVGQTSIDLPDRDLVLRGQRTRLDMTVNLGDLLVAGDLFSTGETTLSCVGAIECGEGYHDGGNGWCVVSGCSDGYHDGGDGASCVKLGFCASRYHDDGLGTCVVSGCANGYHDDGLGTCVASGCANGYHDDGIGTCVTSGCASGYRDNGLGTCVASGCASGYHEGGAGACVKSGTCSPGYHDNGLGTCVGSGCATGYHDNGLGTCVASGCASGYHEGGAGACVKSGTCSPSYHDNGLGTCVGSGCATGYHDNGSGTCVTNGCASGYHDGGAGACVKSGTCSPSYHDNGLGTCVASGCASGYHDGGAGACVTDGTCSSGYHDGGAGACLASGCASGYHDGGAGACVANGTCSSGYRDNGAGTCTPTVIAVATGSSHTCALTMAGAVKCWGKNNYGQLGDGTTIDRATPVSVSGLSSGVAVIATGDWHTCAVTTSGAVKCWGYNADGQLGDGTKTDRRTPGTVNGLTSGMAVIAGGYSHTCAVTTSGAVKCWGKNNYGQLGDGTTTDRSTPVSASGLTSVVAAIDTGFLLTCALTTSGAVECWGANSVGQLGDGTTTDRTTPVSVSGLTSGVAAVCTNHMHACALTTSGGVKCWGYNVDGRLGDGTTTDRMAPVEASGLTSGLALIVTGASHTCAVTTSGAAKCWGANGGGQLGDGTTTDRSAPVDVSGLSSSVAALAIGSGHSCALMTSGAVKCWGANSSGQLGDGTLTGRTTPVDVR